MKLNTIQIHVTATFFMAFSSDAQIITKTAHIISLSSSSPPQFPNHDTTIFFFFSFLRSHLCLYIQPGKKRKKKKRQRKEVVEEG